MKIQYVINEALKLAEEVGNEAAYKSKIISAINHVQEKISEFAKPIKTFTNITSSNCELTLPNNMLNLINIKDSNENIIEITQTDTKLVKVPTDGTYRVCYNKILEKFDDDVDTDEELEIERVADNCLIYGVAAEISMDNEELYPILQNEYNNLLANLSNVSEIVDTGSSINHIEGLWF